MRRGAGTCGISTQPEPWLTVANTSGPGSPAAVPVRRAAGTPGRVGGGSERISDLVCFFKGADKELLPKMVNTLLNLKLSETENGKHVSILDLPENILIILKPPLVGERKEEACSITVTLEKKRG